MKTSNPILILFCALCFTFIIVSCGSSGDSCNTFNQEFEDELESLNVATSAYTMDPSSTNCQAFKDAYLDYIDALGGYEDCANELGNVTEWQQSLQIAEDAINGLVC